MPKFDTPEPISVTIDLGIVGDVYVRASDRVDTVVEVRPRDTSRNADLKAAEITRVEYVNGQLRIDAPRQWRQFAFTSNTGGVEVTIDLPTGSRLDGDLAMGQIHAEGLFGACHLKTGMGNVHLDQVGSLHLNTSYGDITVERVEGDADVSTGSGKIRIRNIDGTATAKNSNGDTRLGAVAGDLRVKAANGDISVEHAGGSVTATTANGGISLDDVIRGTVDISTAAGELEIGIHGGTAAWLDLSAKYGSVRNSLDASDDPEGSDATVTVRGRTSYGDIVIRRAAS